MEERTAAAPGPDEVLVEVAAAGVNFIDVYQREGVYPVPTPFVSGNEGAGTVVVVGSDVTLVAPGDRVAWPQTLGSATRYAVLPAAVARAGPRRGRPRGRCRRDAPGPHRALPHDEHVRRRAGDVALVHAAAGGVGQLLVQMVHARGGTVVATAGGPEKCETARDLGAEHVIDYRAVDDLAAEVRRLTDGRGVDVAYDGVGKDTFDASLASLRPRGTLALFGAASGQVPPFDLQRLNAGGSLFVTRPDRSAPPRDTRRARVAGRRGARRGGRRVAARGDRRALPAQRGGDGIRRPRGPAHPGQAPPPPLPTARLPTSCDVAHGSRSGCRARTVRTSHGVRRAGRASAGSGSAGAGHQRTAMATLRRASAPAALTSCGRDPSPLRSLAAAISAQATTATATTSLTADLGAVHAGRPRLGEPDEQDAGDELGPRAPERAPGSRRRARRRPRCRRSPPCRGGGPAREVLQDSMPHPRRAPRRRAPTPATRIADHPPRGCLPGPRTVGDPQVGQAGDLVRGGGGPSPTRSARAARTAGACGAPRTRASRPS